MSTASGNAYLRLKAMRDGEQRAAAECMGIKDVVILPNEDGGLSDSYEVRGQFVYAAHVAAQDLHPRGRERRRQPRTFHRRARRGDQHPHAP